MMTVGLISRMLARPAFLVSALHVSSRHLVPLSLSPATRNIHSVSDLSITSVYSSRLVNSVQLNQNTIRFRKKNKKGVQDDSDKEDEDDDDEDEGGVEENPLLMEDIPDPDARGRETISLPVASLRVDTIIKSVFPIQRQKAEEMIAKGEVLINGQKPGKRSVELYVGDEVDVLRGVDPEDTTKFKAWRVIIVKLHDIGSQSGRLKITVNRWMDLRIDAKSQNDDE